MGGAESNRANSLRASFVSVWKVGLLPWVSFLVVIVACDQASHRFKSIVVNDMFAFSVWAAIHILLCTIFLLRANRGLKHHFRMLALPTARTHWWQRFGWPRNRYPRFCSRSSARA